MKAYFQDSNFITQFFLFWLVFFFCFAGGAVIGAMLTNGFSDEILALRINVLIWSSAAFIVPSFLVAYLLSEKAFQFLRLDQKSNLKVYLLLVLLIFAAFPFINLLADLNGRITFPESLSGIETQLRAMEARATMQAEKLLTVHSLGGLLFIVFLIAIIPAFGEELFFRAGLQRIIANAQGKTAAIWITAFIFSAFHFRFFGFLPILLLGAFFGYLFVWGRNIWLPIVGHFANNFFIVLYFFLYKNSIISNNFKTLGTGDTWWLGVISGIVFVSGIFLIKKMTLRAEPTP